MDCNQRIAFLLFGALILCAASDNKLLAQDDHFPASPSVNAPKTISARSHQATKVVGSPGGQEFSETSREKQSPPFTGFGPREETGQPNPRQTPLKRNAASSSNDESRSADSRAGSSSAGMVLSTLVVLLLFVLGLAKVFLKRSPYSISGLPIEAIDVLGRRAVDPRNSVYMIKVGSRLILMGSSPTGLSSLAEITDPIEVASLSNVCAAAKQSGPDAAKWLSKLWPGTTTVVETRPFDDQLGEKLFEVAQHGESGRVDSLTIAPNREQHRAG
jgi:flagellar biogenesis protein FliO